MILIHKISKELKRHTLSVSLGVMTNRKCEFLPSHVESRRLESIFCVSDDDRRYTTPHGNCTSPLRVSGLLMGESFSTRLHVWFQRDGVGLRYSRVIRQWLSEKILDAVLVVDATLQFPGLYPQPLRPPGLRSLKFQIVKYGYQSCRTCA
jgi:hypothetical protein